MWNEEYKAITSSSPSSGLQTSTNSPVTAKLPLFATEAATRASSYLGSDTRVIPKKHTGFFR